MHTILPAQEPPRNQRVLRRGEHTPDSTGAAPFESSDADSRPDIVLLCSACKSPVTSNESRIEVGGQHRHVCVNPSGIPFDIACFDDAPGCASIGPREPYWSWFEGYEWQIEVCRSCKLHLGWSFHRGRQFYGLIAARIVEGNA